MCCVRTCVVVCVCPHLAQLCCRLAGCSRLSCVKALHSVSNVLDMSLLPGPHMYQIRHTLVFWFVRARVSPLPLPLCHIYFRRPGHYTLYPPATVMMAIEKRAGFQHCCGLFIKRRSMISFCVISAPYSNLPCPSYCCGSVHRTDKKYVLDTVGFS